MNYNYLKNLGIEKLNQMQESCLQAVLKEEVVLISPTGSGKTIGFLIPLAEKLNPKNPKVQAIVIAPSRELVLQIEQVFKQLGTLQKVNACYGGHSMRLERSSLTVPPAVIIATPGRLLDHITNGNVDVSGVKQVIIDEFDKCLELGFQDEMSQIMQHLTALEHKTLTSATNLENIPAFVGLQKPHFIDFRTDSSGKTNLLIKQIHTPPEDKMDALFSLLCEIGKERVLVFCNHREAVVRMSENLKERGLNHLCFHGGMEQKDRIKSLIKFRNGTNHIFITTDLASRGLDIKDLKTIVHYQLPTTEEIYVHRNGRTARMSEEGTVFAILATDEVCDYIPEHTQKHLLLPYVDVPAPSEWHTLHFDLGKKDKVNKIDIAGLLMKKAKLKKKELGIIEVHDGDAYVAVARKKARMAIQNLKEEKVKGNKFNVVIC